MTAQCCELEVQGVHATRLARVPVSQVVIAGWAGRDASAVQAHIDELAHLGVAPPASTPIFYRVAREVVTQAAEIQVVGSDTSGEVECVLLVDADDIYVSVGSDHTDRRLETISVSQSKQICAKPLSNKAWRMSDLRPHWDRLRLESWIGDEFGDAYQIGGVSALRHPEELLELFAARGGRVEPGTVMFCGTLPVIGGIRGAPALRLKLVDPVLGREIRHSYRTTVLPIMG